MHLLPPEWSIAPLTPIPFPDSRVSLRTFSSVALLAAVVGYLLVSMQLGDRPSDDAGRHPAPPPFVIYRALAPREAYGRVALLELRPGAEPRVSSLSCLRLHYAGGRGLCAIQQPRNEAIVNVVQVFDRSMIAAREVVLDGIPTRLRVSPNGRYAAITTYAEEETPEYERLATRTRFIDLRSGRQLGDLRDFRIEFHESPALSGPMDFSSVAFERDGDRFFATLSTEAERYLVAGSLRERRLTVLRPGVASEALSPDGSRLAVKRLLPDRGFWQLAVIDLRTWTERDLRQGTRSVDDQVEWLDDDHVVYHDVDGESTAVWALPVDGENGPRVLVKDAYSGAIQR
jgi:hypothetical protein